MDDGRWLIRCRTGRNSSLRAVEVGGQAGTGGGGARAGLLVVRLVEGAVTNPNRSPFIRLGGSGAGPVGLGGCGTGGCGWASFHVFMFFYFQQF
jgi:hypothetical protein